MEGSDDRTTGKSFKVWCNMSWDKKQRGGEHRYYYRSERIGKTTVKHYLGRGPLVELAARLDEVTRQERRAERKQWEAEQLQLAQADLILREFRVLTDLLTMATLLVGGFHLHHGQWRKRKEETK